RLKPDAPAGYNPNAHLFDEEVVEAIRSGAPDQIVNIDQELRRAAGECGYRSMLVALGVIQDESTSTEVISYEAPFGVGYLVAQLFSEPAAPAGGPSSSADSASTQTQRASAQDVANALPALARQTTETYVKTGSM